MRRRFLLVLAVTTASVPLAGGFVNEAAQASSCHPDYPCDPPPHPMPQPVWYETGCGTVTVHAFNKYEKTVDTNICPGPMP